MSIETKKFATRHTPTSQADLAKQFDAGILHVPSLGSGSSSLRLANHILLPATSGLVVTSHPVAADLSAGIILIPPSGGLRNRIKGTRFP